MLRKWVVGIVVSSSVLAWGAPPIDLHRLNLGEISGNLRNENKTISGDWHDRQSWTSWVCDGSFAYQLLSSTLLDDFDLVLKDDTTMDAWADLSAASFTATGSYKSAYSACLPLSVNVGMSAKKIHVRARLIFGDDPEMKDLKVEVYQLLFSHIDFGTLLPDSWEEYLTGVVNYAFRRLWGSRLGKLANHYITEAVKKELAGRR